MFFVAQNLEPKNYEKTRFMIYYILLHRQPSTSSSQNGIIQGADSHLTICL